MSRIPETVLDEIQSRADLAQFIGRYVPLKRAGRHFKALCPFHKERTPSFHVNTEKQIFHCFGCGVGGNIFSFLMQQERLTFPEAVRHLAEQLGIALPSQTGAKADGQTAKLVEILEKASRYYERLLAHPTHGRVARAYLQRRGVTDETRQAFRLGCSPMAGWDRLVQAARRTDRPRELLEQAGLVLRGPRGTIDRFRQRVLFPITDVRGRVVGFGGRSLAGQEPKYLNSPDTPVYHKSDQLFGLLQAKDAIVKAKLALIVEGYFDCVLLWQAGFRHVVSPLGTALTPEQARRLLRYTDRVVLAFDADAAGEAASLRGIDVLVEAGLQVQIAQFPAGIDPDEFVRGYGPEALGKLIEEALPVFEFLLMCAGKRYDVRDSEGKVQAAQVILPMIAKVQNAILRTEYVRRLAEALGLREEAVAEELRKVKPRGVVLTAPSTKPQSPIHGAQRLLTALVLDDPDRWDQVPAQELTTLIHDSQLRRVCSVIGELRATGQGPVTPGQVISRLEEQGLAAVVAQLVALAEAEPSKDEAFQKCVERLTREGQQRESEALRERIRLAQAHGHEQEAVELLARYQTLIKGAASVGEPSRGTSGLNRAWGESTTGGEVAVSSRVA